jgi:hypothetical protein
MEPGMEKSDMYITNMTQAMGAGKEKDQPASRHRLTELLLLAYMGSCLLDHIPELPPSATSATYCYRSPLHNTAAGHLPNKLLPVSYLSSSSLLQVALLKNATLVSFL